MGPADALPTGAELDTYWAKRDFARTGEPQGAPADADAVPIFVVQRHRASSLHYDVRLLIDGVLVSWSVPKGPTLDPGVRRLAVRTEDHPVEYADFEGVIPAGEYGGGDVIVWDRGTFEVHQHPDAASALAAGELHLELHGEKLRGHLMLIHTGKGGDRDGRRRWLLFHKDDEHAVEGWDPEEHPRSVLSGRTNDEVAADPEATWSSDSPADRAATRHRPLPADDPSLLELDELGRNGTWTFAERELRLTNLDKVLFPGRNGAPALTKRDLVRYYARMSPLLVRYLADRPVNLHRFPDGVERKGFWHKAVPSHTPEWVDRWDNPAADDGETRTYFVASEPATVAWLANFGAIELHPWTSTTTRPDRPSYALFDIDPGTSTSWDDVLVLARLHRAAFEHLSVAAHPKVTGQRGIQIWVPIAEGPSFKDTTAWVELVSRAIGRTAPSLVSWEWSVQQRSGLARLDYTQNAVNKTLVAPYSVRPAAGAPVSVPITWDELDDPDLRPDRWTVADVADRVEQVGDLFAGVLQRTQRLPEVS